ncbi:MAG: transposase, partial [Boseongicola sp. SB0664_bin_43]|nr:transposase [Boseongicola sp. SB0664_bin_43]
LIRSLLRSGGLVAVKTRLAKRQHRLEPTEALLEPIAVATRRDTRRLKGRERIGERVGKVIGKYKMAKHFTWSIDDDGVFTCQRDDASISAEARLDGLYVIRTSLPKSELDGPGTVRAYKRLSSVERAFRSLKTVDLKVRPIFHRTEPRVRAHVFLCMLAYYVEWHMRRKLKPVLFDDEDAEGAEARRPSVVAPAKISMSARAKAGSKRTPDGDPVHSFRTLLDDLATITRNTMAPRMPGTEHFKVTTRPTPLQRKAFKLLSVTP